MDEILNAVLKKFPFPSVLVNERREILYCNNRFLELTGKSRKDIIERPVLNLINKCQDFGEGQSINRSSIPGRSPLFQSENANGERIFLKVNEVDIEYESFKRKLVILQDVSETISLRDENQHLSRLASVGELFSFVLHDIGNIVTVIKGCAELAGTQKETKENYSEEIEKIKIEVGRIEEIIGTFLGFTRKGDSNLELLSACELMEYALELKKYSLNKKGVECRIKEESNGNMIIAGNRTLLMQVLLNLIDNAEAAIENREKRVIDITLKSNDKRVIIDVADSGDGIPKQNQKKIFDAFYTTKRKGSGTGLGLSICKRIVHKHGGDLFLESSRPGRGSRFRISLPAAGAGQDAGNSGGSFSKSSEEDRATY